MCRRCGEPDRRPGAKRRREISKRLLERYGNGTIAPCYWCDELVGLATAVGYLAIPAVRRRLRIQRMERDRLVPKGPYSLYNLVPSCPPCNKARAYSDAETYDLPQPDGRCLTYER